MKRTIPLGAALCCALLTGCMLPKYNRLIPENKSARLRIVSPFHGYIEIDTRVINDPNQLGELPQPTVIIGPTR